MLTYQAEERLNRLYYSAVRPREAVADGRAWLLDCFADEYDRETIESLNWLKIVASVDRYYEGGYAQFLRDSLNLKAPR